MSQKAEVIVRPAVIYLNRHNVGSDFSAAFLHSILPGHDSAAFDLIILMKGECSNRVQIESLCSHHGFMPYFIEIPDDLFDLGAYRIAAEVLKNRTLLLFNSYTRLLAGNWMELYFSGFSALGEKALLGATGSWETHGNNPPFPNPHIRTNAFMIERDILLSLKLPVVTKRDCNQFEAGPHGLTRHILSIGGKVGVVGRDGAVYGPDTWPQANIFRSGNQQNLLAADNRTQDYQTSSGFRRRKLAKMAWGSEAKVTGEFIVTRLKARFAWRISKKISSPKS